MKKFIRLLGLFLFLPTVFVCILLIQVYWINSIVLLPFKIYNYGLIKGIKRILNDNLSFTQQILGNF